MKTYSCPKCEIVIKHMSSFYRHKKTCIGTRKVPILAIDSLTPDGSYLCRNCKVIYKQKSSLYRHLKLCTVRPLCAKEKLPNGPTQIESIGKNGPSSEESTECSGTKLCKRQARMHCFVNTCKKTFYRSDSLLCHLEREHSDEPELIEKIRGKYEALTFENLDSFFKWKEEVEISTHTYFSKQSGKRVLRNGSYTYSYYICQHHGSGEPHRASGEVMKTDRKQKIGRVKLGNMCIARMYVKQDNTTGIVYVRYVSAHQLSHSPSYKDTIHHPIPDSKRELIKEQLSIGIPKKDIYSTLIKNAGDGALPHKGDLISLNIIRSIDRKLKSQARIHPDDASAVLLLVKQLQAETYDPILVYKPQGGGVVVGDPGINELEDQDNLFMLGFQTKQQLDVLKLSSIACMDWTHKTNQYDFQLFTIVVRNDFGSGYPVAHFVCNRTDAKVLHFFFNALKLRCLNLALNEVITDDDPAIWNAFVSGFLSMNLGEAGTQNDELGQIAAKRLLCHWRIHRNWMKSLRRRVSDRSLEQEMYIALRIILYCKDIKEFEELSIGFCEKYRHLAPTFVTYFERYYLKRAEIWASCFRKFPHENCNTIMFVENFHNRLKTFLMKCKPKKRLHDLIHMLLGIEKHDYCRRKEMLDLDMPTVNNCLANEHDYCRWKEMLDLDMPTVTNCLANEHDYCKKQKMLDLDMHVKNCLANEDRHGRGISIPNDHVISCGSSKWEVKSESIPHLLHTVTEVSGYNCSKAICFERCIEITCAGLCQHSYTCTCSDLFPICKHIHKVHSLEMSKFAEGNTASGEDPHDEIEGGEEMFAYSHENTLAEPGELVTQAQHSSKRQIDSDNKEILDRIRDNISELKIHLNSEQSKGLLTHINEVLGNLVFECKTTEKMCL